MSHQAHHPDTKIEGLDHGIIAVRDLEVARNTYENLGFTMTRRGRHEGWGTANYCIMFGPDYLELLGIVDPTQFDAGLTDFLKDNGEGLLKVVARSADLDKTRAHLLAHKFSPMETQKLGRWLEMPDGDVMPHFKLMHLPAEDMPGFSGFICEHLTPDMVWRPEWMTHENGAKAVHAYVILHDAPETLADHYQRLFDLPVHVTQGRVIVETGGGKIIFATLSEVKLLYPNLDWQGSQKNGTMVAATIAVESTDQTEEYLKGAGVSYHRYKDGSVLIDPKEAHGVALSFQAV